MKAPRERVRIGWASSIAGAVAAAVLGVIVGLGALALLWWNEARPNPAHLAAGSHPVPPHGVDTNNEGAFVSVTAAVRADAPLGDAQYLRPGPYLRLARDAEMFAWIERRADADGRGPRYTYDRAWTGHPQDSARFHDPAGHENPPMRLASARWTQAAAAVGDFAFTPRRAALPAGEHLDLTDDLLAPGVPNGARTEQGYLYLGTGSLAAPAVGDVRAAYTAYVLGVEATLFGDQRGAAVVPHADERGEIYHLVPGGRDAALRRMDAEFRLLRWLIRLAGFVLAYLALNLALAPVSAMFDVLPPLGRATRSFVALVTLPLALGVSALTIVISAAVHSPLGLLLLAAALIALATVLARRSRRG